MAVWGFPLYYGAGVWWVEKSLHITSLHHCGLWIILFVGCIPATIGFWFPPTFASLALFCHVQRYHFWLAIFLVHEKTLTEGYIDLQYWFTTFLVQIKSFTSIRKFLDKDHTIQDLTARHKARYDISSHLNMVDILGHNYGQVFLRLLNC